MTTQLFTYSGGYQITREEALQYHSRHFSIIFTKADWKYRLKHGQHLSWIVSVVLNDKTVVKETHCSDPEAKSLRDALILETCLNLDVV